GGGGGGGGGGRGGGGGGGRGGVGGGRGGGAARRGGGGPAVMRAQLDRLIEVAKLRHVTIQVVPFSRGGHAAAGGSFSVLRFSEPEVPDVVYIEQLTSALYLDKRQDVDHYMEVLNPLATEALPPASSSRFVAEIIRDI